ncbi:MAG: 3-oxoacyl-ACP reductase, partial [Acidobacteria bacterium]
MDIRVDGKAALVTGASRGIGLAIAKAIIDSGGKVCITARKQDELDEALATLGSGAIAVAGGVDDRDHAEAAIATCIAEFGSLDILVNNAATNPQFGPLIQADPAAVSKI